MPALREWMIHFPSDWTPAQAHGFCQDTTLALVNHSRVIASAVGPVHTAACFLTAVLNLTRGNPVYHEDIKNVMASVYDLIDSLDPFKGATKT